MEYEIVEEGGKFVVYSVVQTNWGGPARNYIAERESRESAELILDRVKDLGAK